MSFKWLNRALSLFFVAALVLQFNDPDPVIWILVYGLAAYYCRLAELRTESIWMVVFALGCALWAGYLLWQVPTYSFDEEKLREALGLLIVSFWVGTIYIKFKRVGSLEYNKAR